MSRQDGEIDRCVCNEEFKGELCSIPKTCVEATNPCLNGAECVEGAAQGVYECINCPASWRGENCEICMLFHPLKLHIFSVFSFLFDIVFFIHLRQSMWDKSVSE